MSYKCGKNEGGNLFPPILVFDLKLDLNSGLHAKNQREISCNKVRRLHRLFRGGKCDKEGGNGIRTGGNAL